MNNNASCTSDVYTCICTIAAACGCFIFQCRLGEAGVGTNSPFYRIFEIVKIYLFCRNNPFCLFKF